MQNINLNFDKIIKQAIVPPTIRVAFSIIVPLKDSELDRVVVLNEWVIPLN